MNLVCFGLGYTSSYLIDLIKSCYDNYSIIATKRDISKKYDNIKIIEFDKFNKIPDNTTHILISIPPTQDKDIVFEKYADQILKLPNSKWIGYLSATSVYGDHNGNWVDETAKTSPTNNRGLIRLNIENNWLDLFHKYKLPIVIFRLAGIYGPGRNQIERITSGEKLPVIEAKNHFFSRIHVEDIARILLKSIEKPTAGEIFNVADDLPSESSEITKYAYDLLGILKPQPITLEEANLSPMGREFYMDNKRVCNKKVKRILGVKLKYPTYIEGMKNLNFQYN